MVDMTPQRWRETHEYIREIFGREDEALARITEEASAAGLPDIAVDAAVGRLLMILTAMTRGKLAIEVGTLAGYSAAWIVRGLKPGGRLITIEIEPNHASLAQRQFDRLGIADQVQLRLGDAAEVLEELARQLEPESVDVAFLDADKQQYPDNWRVLRPLIGVGGLIVIDNALGSSQWWIGDDHPARHAADAVCRMIADDPDFEAVALPLRQGVLVGRRMGA